MLPREEVRVPKNPSSLQVTDVPGKCGVPGCAYFIASNLGSGALCQNDYYNCGGNVGPLLTTTVSGTTGLGCAYTAVPTCNDCTKTTCDPPEPTETTTITPLDQMSERTCWNEDDFPGHADVHRSDVSYLALLFCVFDGTPFSFTKEPPVANLHSDFSKVHTYTRRKQNGHKVNYDYEVDWKPGCTTTQDNQGVAYPMGFVTRYLRILIICEKDSTALVEFRLWFTCGRSMLIA